MMIPGEYFPTGDAIIANKDKKILKITVANTGDRPIQVGSHTHFSEANKALEFDREKSLGFHLNISAGTSIRFEPGESKHVQLVEFGGTKTIYGFSGMVSGNLDEKRNDAIKKLHENGFKNSLEDTTEEQGNLEIPRNRYVELFGPSKGDKVRLADTDLILEVEEPRKLSTFFTIFSSLRLSSSPSSSSSSFVFGSFGGDNRSIAACRSSRESNR